MEAKRVKQILSSSADINVTFQGTEVWIDSLSEDGKSAIVHLRGTGEERTTVGINDLQEVER